MPDDTWRRKKYYEPRILIPTANLLDNPYQGLVLCLSAGQADLLRNLVQYADRRSTFVSEYHANHYLAPTNAEWDDIEASVADLKDKLMDCTELETLLQSILDAVECVCPLLAAQRVQSVIDPEEMRQDEVGRAIDWSEDVPDVTVPSQAETAACEIAQLWYQAGFEIITEGVIPASRWAFDTLIPVVAGIIGGITGGLTLPAFLGAYTIAEAVQELLELFWDGAESNLWNWMISNKDELICAIYNKVLLGGNSITIWQAVYADVVSGAGGISAGDKLIIYLFMGPIAYVSAYLAYTEDNDWAQANVTPGYCDECEIEPIIGNDWWAMPLPIEENTITLYKPPNSWDYGNDCWEYAVVDGQESVGYVIEVTVHDNQHWSRMSNWDGCAESGTGYTPNTSETWSQSPPHFFFYAKSDEIDDEDCQDTLAPGSTAMPSHNKQVGPITARQGLQNGSQYAPACNTTLVFKYIIYKGTSPPE